MAVNLEWTYDDAVIEEPFANTAGVTYTHKLKNTGTNSAQEIGFYLRPATLEGDVDNPSTDGVLADWYDVLTKGSASGSPSPGWAITQGAVTTRFTHSAGDSAEDPIPLTVGSGTAGDTLAPGEEIELQFTYNPEAGDPTRRLYAEIALTFIEV
ncbi:MAG: hypothetical protein ACXABY_00270 [Candidatus Thorarchaeota archaeon]|jgi:hypothetical protein